MITKEMKEMFVKTAMQVAEDIIDCGGTINAGCADVAARIRAFLGSGKRKQESRTWAVR